MHVSRVEALQVAKRAAEHMSIRCSLAGLARRYVGIARNELRRSVANHPSDGNDRLPGDDKIGKLGPKPVYPSGSHNACRYSIKPRSDTRAAGAVTDQMVMYVPCPIRRPVLACFHLFSPGLGREQYDVFPVLTGVARQHALRDRAIRFVSTLI
jgi:hypothetical protein